MNPIEQRADKVSEKIQELVKAGFTGSITVSYNLQLGRLMDVHLITEERIIQDINIVSITK